MTTQDRANGLRALLLAVAASATFGATPSHAREYCPDRPGINTPPCTMEPSKLSAEASFGDWTHDSSSDEVDDTVIVGDLALRYGLGESTELRLGWTAYGHMRSKDRISGDISRQSGTGDVTLGIKQNLLDPEGKSFSVALLPSVTLPTGGHAIGSGDWSASLSIPVNVPISDSIAFIAAPEIDAATDEDRKGRHLAYGSAAGLAISLGEAINLAIEAQVLRDDDPQGHTTETIGGIAAGFSLSENAQFDCASEFALNANAPDVRVYVGFARRF